MGRTELISHKHKCIFIHIPKCAGSSIEKFFIGTDWWNIDRNTKHILAKEAKDLYKEYWDDYFKFSFVRNPWDRMVSWYFFRKRKYGIENLTSFLTVHEISTESNAWYLPESLLYSDWLFDEGGNQLVDFIGKFENLQEDFNTICDKIGIPHQKLPHINKRNHKHYTEYYDDETRKLVAEKYAKDIEIFGYEFGED